MRGRINGIPPMAAAKLPTTSNRTGTWRFERPVFSDRLAPCSEACPLGQNIPAIMAFNRQGAFRQAYHEIRKENPFPGICGKMCFHPCERVCNRARFDEPVSIQEMEYLVFRLAAEEAPSKEERRDSFGRHVGVLGGGVAGLSCAYFLRLLGHRVTVLEPGPHLEIFDLSTTASGPDMKYLENEMNNVLGTGIHFRANTPLEAGYFPGLEKEFQAVYVSPGVSGFENPTSVSGPGDRAVYMADEVEAMIKDGKPPSLRGKVAVTGGGNRALEAARRVKELGGEPVVLLPLPHDRPSLTARELEDAEKSGIALEWGSEAFALIERNGRIGGLMCVKRVEPGPSRPEKETTEPDKAVTFEFEAGTVIIASSGRTGLGIFPPIFREKGLLVVDSSRSFKRAPRFVKENDLSRMLVRRMAQGKEAALSLDLGLRRRPFNELGQAAVGRLGALSFEAYRTSTSPGDPRPLGNVVRARELNWAYYEKAPRIKPSSSDRGFTKRQGILSAKRCFQCGRCNSCQKCYQYCPDLAIGLEPETGRPVLDEDHCKGCGICFEECPRGTVSMENE